MAIFGQMERPKAPQKKVDGLHFLGKKEKRDPHKIFGGDLGGQKRGPKRAILGHNKFSLLFLSGP